MSNTGWIALGIVFLVVLFAGQQYASDATGDSPISVASRTVSLDISSDGALEDRADGLGIGDCSNNGEIRVYEAASNEWLCGTNGAGAGGSFVIELDDVVTVATSTVSNFLDSQFIITESPANQANISIEDIYVSNTGDRIAGNLRIDDGNALRISDTDNSHYFQLDTPVDLTSSVSCTIEEDATPLDLCVTGGASTGDALTVNSTLIDTTGNLLDGDIDFTHVDGGAGGPDNITATVGCTNCIETGEITDDEILEADLDAVDAAVDEECLTFETDNSGFEWQTCGGGGANSFETHNVDNGTDPVAASSTDTLNWTSGTGITITGDSGTDTITVASTLGTAITTGEITDDEILEADLDAVDAAVDEECLTFETTGSGFEWQDCIGDITGGDGITNTAGTIAVDLVDDTDGTSATVTSESGLEFLAGELSLLRGCSNGELQKWVSSTESWDCSADSTGGSPTFDSIASGTNTTASMVVGSGADISLADGGLNQATQILNNVNNDSGGTLYQCTPVYISAFDAPSDLPEVLIADADGSGTMPALGLLLSDVANGANGFVVVTGQIDNLDTVTGEAWAVGDALYVNDSGTSADSDCGNALTNVRPANTDDNIQAIARVERVHASTGRLKILGAGRSNDVPNLADDSVWVGSATNVATALALTDCDSSTDDDLQYDVTTNAFSCDTTADDDSPEAGDYAAGSIDGDDVNSNIAGRSLALTAASPDTLDADAELYTDSKGLYWEDPVATDDFNSIWITRTHAVTLTKIWCESDQTVTLMLQVDDGTPADVDSVDLVCISTPDTDDALDGDASMAIGDRLDMAVTSVASTPTWVSVFWEFEYDD